jgi:hypothetical protein
MIQKIQPPLYTLASDEKMAVVVVYTPGILFRGEVVVKKMIRVNTWLRTNTAPDRICLYNTKALVLSSEGARKPSYFTELYISTKNIEAFHLLPPANEPLDYDPTEPNRRMLSVSALLGSFRFDGSMRLSTQSNLAKFLDISREAFIPMYDSQVSNQLIPSIGVLSVPYLLIRQESCAFTQS